MECEVQVKLIGKLPDKDIEILNGRLTDYFGKTEDLPNFRVVWSDDQFEKRVSHHSLEGFQLLNPEVQERPKYRQYIQSKYIIERLTLIPSFIETDLVENFSYECIWVFESNGGIPLIPIWPVCWNVCSSVMNAIKSQGNYIKYKDPEIDPKDGPEVQKARLKMIEEELFGNETDLKDALHLGEGVTVPSNYTPTES